MPSQLKVNGRVTTSEVSSVPSKAVKVWVPACPPIALNDEHPNLWGGVVGEVVVGDRVGDDVVGESVGDIVGGAVQRPQEYGHWSMPFGPKPKAQLLAPTKSAHPCPSGSMYPGQRGSTVGDVVVGGSVGDVVGAAVQRPQKYAHTSRPD